MPVKKEPCETKKVDKIEKEVSKSKESVKKNVAKKQNDKGKTEPDKVKQPKNLEQAFSMVCLATSGYIKIISISCMDIGKAIKFNTK